MPPREDLHRLGRYDLSHIHSEGGLGRIWRSTDPVVGRVVALKELRPEQASQPQARARFVHEAQITGQLEHPNIVPVYEVGERKDDHRPYYTMRFIDGPTLADSIREEFERYGGRWPHGRQRMIRALCSVCHAIDHAHSRGVIHRDLKPDNIILGQHGEVLLLDWGLAKRLADPELEPEADHAPAGADTVVLRRTEAGSVMGTIAYMSPEQADGRSVDKRTDIYGLGAILFEILTGRPPHVGKSAVAVLEGILEDDSPRAGGVDAGVPPALDAICARAMAKLPEDRYPSVASLLDDLECWLADEPVTAFPDGARAGAARWVRRHQSWAYAGALTLFVVAVVASIAAVLLGSAAEREHQLRERGVGAAAQLAARAIAIEIDLRWSVLESAAVEPRLAHWLRQAAGAEAQLQRWLEGQFAAQAQRTLATSWIVMDRSGVQRARAPFAESIGTNYAFRDYFHGSGRDFDVGEGGATPIRHAHRSIVFRSQVTQRNMVAFSVPVRDPDDAERVVGVLGMTVELGSFGVLELGSEDTQLTALVDIRQDWRGQRGLVLQHAELAKAQTRLLGKAGGLPSYYMPELRIAEFQALGADRLRQLVSLPPSTPEPQLEADYRDPVGGEFSGTWLAAFEPVVVRNSDTGWIVIAQERDQLD